MSGMNNPVRAEVPSLFAKCLGSVAKEQSGTCYCTPCCNRRNFVDRIFPFAKLPLWMRVVLLIPIVPCMVLVAIPIVLFRVTWGGLQNFPDRMKRIRINQKN